MNKTNEIPEIAVLCWDTSLTSLEGMPGNIMNPDTFSFPVERIRVKDANFHTVVEDPDPNVHNAMIKATKRLEDKGIKAITTDCGFNAILQRELANSVKIPVFTSSLLQVPFVAKMINEKSKIGIITAFSNLLTDHHLKQVGIKNSERLCIVGMETQKEFTKVFYENSSAEVNPRKIEEEVVGVAKHLMKQHNDIGAIVLECTDLPPFSKAIQRITKLPIFDIVTLVNMIHRAIQVPTFNK